MKTGIATVPLDWGRCPKWLFERMKRLSRGILIAIVQEFGPEEVLKRLADPIWFQSLGCVIGFDWNSSGLSTTTMGAIKEAVRGLENELGLFVCGGKRVSRKTPQEIEQWAEILGLDQNQVAGLVYASRMAAKVDSCLVQDDFSIYAHNFVFTKSGRWTVVQQGLNTDIQKARRYHWYSPQIKELIEEPHSGIISGIKLKPLNLVARQSRKNKEISTQIVKEEPNTFLKDISLIMEKGSNELIKYTRLPGFSDMELRNVEFHWHPVLEEKFDLKRLRKTIFMANYQEPENFEQLLILKGVGPKTIRALSLVAEIIYGARPSYQDPARYSFAHGGKDGTPFFVNRTTYDKLLDIMEKGIKKSRIAEKEKDSALKRLERINQAS
jgi:hypothetical protein